MVLMRLKQLLSNIMKDNRNFVLLKSPDEQTRSLNCKDILGKISLRMMLCKNSEAAMKQKTLFTMYDVYHEVNTTHLES